MAAINYNFLQTNEKWSSADIQNLEYSFLSFLPSYYALVAVHFLDFSIGTESQLSANSNSDNYDQQDAVRFLLDSPSLLSSYAGLETVNTILVNMASYRVSFSDVINASFSESIGTGDIIVMNQDAYNGFDPSKGYLPTTVNQLVGNAGDVFINSLDTDALTKLNSGEYGFWLILHELGHAIGGLDDVRNTAQSGTSVDFQKYTVMSDNTYGGVYASGLQLLDIAALQDTYGTINTTTRSGDTNYSLGHGLGFYGATVDDAFLYTIWDGGGNDTIDASGFNVAAEIDLREGHFSSIGKDAFGGAWVIDAAATPFDPDPGNVAIAYGTVIENATGTAFADHLIGNDHDNVLKGGAGVDRLEGNGGTDTADYSGDATAGGKSGITVILDNSGDGTVTDGFGDTDTLHSIENITGTSKNDTFYLQGPAGRVIDGGLGGKDTVNYAGSVVHDQNTGLTWDAHGLAHDTLKGIEGDGGARTVLPDYDADVAMGVRTLYDYSGYGGDIDVNITLDGSVIPPLTFLNSFWWEVEATDFVSVDLGNGAVHTTSASATWIDYSLNHAFEVVFESQALNANNFVGTNNGDTVTLTRSREFGRDSHPRLSRWDGHRAQCARPLQGYHLGGDFTLGRACDQQWREYGHRCRNIWKGDAGGPRVGFGGFHYLRGGFFQSCHQRDMGQRPVDEPRRRGGDFLCHGRGF